MQHWEKAKHSGSPLHHHSQLAANNHKKSYNGIHLIFIGIHLTFIVNFIVLLGVVHVQVVLGTGLRKRVGVSRSQSGQLLTNIPHNCLEDNANNIGKDTTMNTAVSQEEAQSIFDEMRAHELAGCTTFCVDKSLWNSRKSSGSDHRRPSEVMARHLFRVFGVKVAEDAPSVGSFVRNAGARLSTTHPYTIVWGDSGRSSSISSDEDVFEEETEVSEVRR